MPHRPPMRLVETLLSCDSESAEVEALVEGKHLLLGVDDRLDPLTAIELLAQAQATAQGYRDLSAGKPVKMGYLVGISSFELQDSARRGERIIIRVTTSAEMGDFALVSGEVRANDRLLAKGALKLWINSAEESHA